MDRFVYKKEKTREISFPPRRKGICWTPGLYAVIVLRRIQGNITDRISTVTDLVLTGHPLPDSRILGLVISKGNFPLLSCHLRRKNFRAGLP